MLAIIQIILSLVLTVIFGINNPLTFSLIDIIKVLLVFIGYNLLITFIFILLFILFIYTTEKIDYRKFWKHRVADIGSRYLFRFYYRVRVVLTGKENIPTENNYVVYSNHIEYTDPLYLMQVYNKTPLAFVAKEPLFKYPVLKNILVGLGNLSITKFADRSALETILKAIKQVKNGMPMGIFPEGKRTYSNELIEFKPGAFKLAQKAKADISPVCLYNMHDLSKKWRILPTKVYIHVLPILKYEDYKDLDTVSLSKKVYDIIDDQLRKYKEKVKNNV